jgi:DNA primase
MSNANPSGEKFPFNPRLLPSPFEYYKSQDIGLASDGNLREAFCPFHLDARRSLRVYLDSGGYYCIHCGARGNDVVDFHMAVNGMGFIEAVKDLGAWEPKT